MTVFKTILKILNKLKGMIILYTAILVAITALNQTSGNNMTNFEDSKPSVLIVNKDSEDNIAKGFEDYISKHSEIKDIDTKDEDKINDAIFYRDVNYVIYIPKDFGKNLLDGKNPSLEYKSCGDEYSSYAQMMVEKYIKTVLIYKDYYSGVELISKVNKVVDKDTKVYMKTTLDTSKLSSMTQYFNILNYALLAGCVYCISMILASLNDETVRKRTIISSFNYKKYNRIVLLSNSIVIFAMWILYMILALILFKDLMFSSNGLGYVINSFVFTICSLTIGFLIGNITQNKNAIGGIVNVIALGTSFLCGCFVPFEYMPDYVLKIAHILPTYYYVANNQLIKTMEVFNFESIKPLLINGAVIVISSFIFVAVTNYVSKRKQIIN
ncbi:ABC transporter permease [Eubacterium sp. AF19-12LB]|uniref:ABC transporter permease n=1 Tax=Eubacterium sp. AF19-12LB TaxID=2293106 RepID=UPI000E5322CE|nr:ABC transporter permease [Eubacterium sp. AF19-12LB]RHR36978.1 ABC transporter permease [Eubacterium sp. AF19-12LB]